MPTLNIRKYDAEFSVYLLHKQIFHFPSDSNKILSTNSIVVLDIVRKILRKYDHMYDVWVEVDNRRYNGLFSTWHTNGFDKKFINTIRSQVNNEIRNGKRN